MAATELGGTHPTGMLSCFFYIRYYYRPQRSFGQGYFFTRVCDSVQGGGAVSVHAGIPLPRQQTPPRSRESPSGKQTPAYGQ